MFLQLHKPAAYSPIIVMELVHKPPKARQGILRALTKPSQISYLSLSLSGAFPSIPQVPYAPSFPQAFLSH